jgi:hypothetical protein
MSNALISIKPIETAIGQVDDKAFAAMVSSNKWLPRVQLMTGTSEKCKAGEFPVNHYALVTGQVHTDLGAEVDVLVVDMRFKAVHFGEQILTTYDVNSAEAKDIMSKADIQDSGCMFGPEFLIYIPSQKKFALLHCNGKSSRKEAPAIRDMLCKAGTLMPKKCQNAKYTWFSIQIKPCNVPFDLPTEDQVNEEVQRFRNPPKDEVELAPEEAGRAR